MTNTMNQPKLETLDYEPEQPRIDKYDVCRYCGACRAVRPSGEWQYDCRCYEKIVPPEQPTEQPNTNAMIFEQVTGSIKVALELLRQLRPMTDDVDGCITTLKSWQDNNLKHLQKAFE